MKINQNIAISDSGFIFNPATGDSFTTNAVGGEMIHLIKKGSSKDQILESLMALYDVEKTTLEKDLADFVTMLESFQILRNTSHE
jgi:hypothetical protein